MSEYKFWTDKFALSEKSVHYLRGRFNYETVDYLLIDQLIIDKGPQIRNWPIALLIGLVFIIAPFGLFLFSIMKGETHNIAMSIELGILPFIFGFAATYQSVKRGYILKLKYNHKTISLPIQQLKKTQQINSLIQFLMANKLTRSKLTIVPEEINLHTNLSSTRVNFKEII
jgi:hypothetical protein